MKCWRPGRHLEGQAAGMRGVGHVDRRRRAGVGDDGQCRPSTGARSRNAAACGSGAPSVVVVAQDRGDAVVDRRAHAVEARSAPSSWQKKKRSAGSIAVDGVDQCGRGRSPPGWRRCGERQEVGRAVPSRAGGLREMYPPSGRIWRSSSSARWRVALRNAEAGAGRRQCGEGERDARAQTVLAVRHLLHHRT